MQLGKAIGKKASEESKANATQQLSTYLKTEVSSRLETNYSSTQTILNNNMNEETIQQNTRNIAIESNVQLIALQYTDSFYEKKSKTWFTCAYIKKSEAFDKLKPLLDDEKEKFYAFYNNAENEEDIFSKIRIYNGAKNASKDFKLILEYASLFADNLVEAEYRKDRTAIASIDSKIKEIRTKTPLYLVVQNDSENKLFSVITSEFQKQGWSTTTKKDESPYTVNAKINFNENNEHENDGSIFYVFFPDIEIFIRGRNGGIFSFSQKGERVTGYNLKKVESRACSSLVSTIEDSLSSKFSDFLIGK